VHPSRLSVGLPRCFRLYLETTPLVPHSWGIEEVQRGFTPLHAPVGDASEVKTVGLIERSKVHRHRIVGCAVPTTKRAIPAEAGIQETRRHDTSMHEQGRSIHERINGAGHGSYQDSYIVDTKQPSTSVRVSALAEQGSSL
jgi:hypothetical protein